MGSKVGSTGNVLVTQDYSPDNEIKLIRRVNYLKSKVTGLLTKSTSGKMSKTEWLTNVETELGTDVENIGKEAENLENQLAEGRFKGYEASVRDLIGKMKELDELYRKGKLEESLVAEENAGETSQGKSVAEENAGEANEGCKMAVVGIGGVGKVRLENKKAINMTYGDISGAEENEGDSSKTVVGMGGVGDTDIKNEGTVTMKFGNIKT